MTRRFDVTNRNDSAMPDDIATHLYLDVSLIARLQQNRVASRELSDPSKWIAEAGKFVDDFAGRSLPDSTKRLLSFGTSAILIGALVWIAWYWASTGRFIESTDDA